MIAPGCIINASGQVLVSVQADPTPHHFSGGIPFGATDRVIIATNPPVGLFEAVAGIRRTAKGALHGIATTSPDDVFLGGLRVSKTGQIVYTQTVPQRVFNGNPSDSDGAICVLDGV